MDNVDLENNVRTYRRLHNMSQKELAELIGTSRAYISKLEQGLYFPKITLIYKLSQIFNIPVQEVFYPKGEQPPIRF